MNLEKNEAVFFNVLEDMRDYLPKMDMNFLRQKLGLPLAVRG